MGRTFDGTGLDRVLRTAVDSGAVPHVAAIAADADGVFYAGGAGPRVVGEPTGAVGPTTQFRIMSMTKLVCTVAALQLVERGAIDLDAPVTEYRPEFAGTGALTGFDGDRPVIVPPATPVTVRHLITHTSGLGYWFWSEDLVRWEAATGTPNVVPGRLAALTAPLTHQPGTAFTYGINTDWLGRVVEKAAGTTLDRVIADGVTGPLGMDDTMFLLDDARRANCVSLHVRGEDGAWTSAGEILNQQPEWFAGGHGLYSTPQDYVTFQRALLRGGELDGVRILRPETVDAAFTNQIGELDFPTTIPTTEPATTATLTVGEGWKWGFGLLLNQQDQPGGRRAGTGAWAGLFNTHFFIDRTSGICASIYTNSLPFVEPAGAWQTYQDFERALYAAL